MIDPHYLNNNHVVACFLSKPIAVQTLDASVKGSCIPCRVFITLINWQFSIALFWRDWRNCLLVLSSSFCCSSTPNRVFQPSNL